MAIPNKLNPPENSLNPKEFQVYPPKANGISLWAFLLSIFIYISIFYSFNLSPSSLLNTTKFWYFVTNTLILIIAADFSVFSSTKKQADLYEEYAKNRRSYTFSFPSSESQYRESAKTKVPQQKVETIEHSQQSQENIKEVNVVHKSKFPENKLEIVVTNDLGKLSDNYQENMPEIVPKANNEACAEEKNEETLDCSLSDKAIPVNNQIIPSSSEPEKQEPYEEENEFSAMSDEELNIRVEEFIQNFNRQIRLRAAQNRFSQM